MGGTGFEPAVPEAAGLRPAARPLAHPSQVGGLGSPPIDLASIRRPRRATAGRAEQLPAVGWRPGLSMICRSAGGGRSRDVGFRTPSASVLETDRLPKPHPLGGPWPLLCTVPEVSGLMGATSERRAVRVGWHCTLARTSPWSTAGLGQTVGVTRPRCSTGLCPGAARRRRSASCRP